MDKRYQDMTVPELRAALDVYNRESQPPASPHPDVPGVDPTKTKLSPEVRDEAAGLYAAHILAKNANAVTDVEREFLRKGILAWSQENL
jgi:hypothetical protein